MSGLAAAQLGEIVSREFKSDTEERNEFAKELIKVAMVGVFEEAAQNRFSPYAIENALSSVTALSFKQANLYIKAKNEA